MPLKNEAPCWIHASFGGHAEAVTPGNTCWFGTDCKCQTALRSHQKVDVNWRKDSSPSGVMLSEIWFLRCHSPDCVLSLRVIHRNANCHWDRWQPVIVSGSSGGDGAPKVGMVFTDTNSFHKKTKRRWRACCASSSSSQLADKLVIFSFCLWQFATCPERFFKESSTV